MQRQDIDSVPVPTGESFFRPAPGAADEGLGLRLFNHPSRAVCAVLSVGFFSFLWMSDGGLFLPLAVGFLYVFLTLPRWKDLGLGGSFFIAAIPPFFYVMFEGKDGPLGLPLLGHFAVIAPAVFVCITPLGVTLPRFSKTGRAAFILCALPFFLVLGSQYWPDLDRAISALWSVLWLPIGKVSQDAVISVGVFICLNIWGRAADIGMSDRVTYAFMATFGLLCFLRNSESLLDSRSAMDATLAAGVFLLCLWPGRPQADGEPTG